MALERVPGHIHFRLDKEVQDAIKEMGARLGTENVSEIVRSTLLIGLERARPVEEIVLRRARAEGILAGLGQIKRKVGAAVDELLQELRPGAPGQEEGAHATGSEANPSAPGFHPDAG